MQFVARMDVGYMHFDDGALKGFQCVKNGHGCERLAGRVYDQRVRLGARCVYPIDQDTFVIGLVKFK